MAIAEVAAPNALETVNGSARVRCHLSIAEHCVDPGTNLSLAIRTRRRIIALLRSLDRHAIVVTNGGSTCQVRSTRLLALGLWLAVAVIGVLLVTATAGLWKIVGYVPLTFGVFSAFSVVDARLAARQFDAPITHLLSDVVRSPEAPRGSGAALAQDLIQLGTLNNWVIGGEASNEQLMQRFYLSVGFDRDAHDTTRFYRAAPNG